MKRIKSACITQTIVFSRSQNEPEEYAERKVQEEIKRYMYRLNRENTRYKILSEKIQENGSRVMEIVKEYGNRIPVGTYLD
ncbi:MAG: hypothetical protein Q4G60_12345 [bacterium]|nr:hypothetical protein [bacterium]